MDILFAFCEKRLRTLSNRQLFVVNSRLTSSLPTRNSKAPLGRHLEMLGIALCGLLYLLLADELHANQCPSDILRLLDTQGASIESGSLKLTTSQGTFGTALKHPTLAPNPDEHRIVYLSAGAFPESQALTFRVGSCTNSAVCKGEMQKVNFHFLYSRPREKRMLEFGVSRYIGFLMKVEEAAPDWPIQVFQIWQGTPHIPPLSATLEKRSDASTLSLVLRVANDQTGSNPSAKTVLIGQATLEFGHWYSFILEVTPDSGFNLQTDDRTTIALFVKQLTTQGGFTRIVRYSGSIGYTVTHNAPCIYAGNCRVRRPNHNLDFLFGLYRRADRSPAIVSFDNVKLGKSFDSANPETWCKVR